MGRECVVLNCKCKEGDPSVFMFQLPPFSESGLIELEIKAASLKILKKTQGSSGRQDQLNRVWPDLSGNFTLLQLVEFGPDRHRWFKQCGRTDGEYSKVFFKKMKINILFIYI